MKTKRHLTNIHKGHAEFYYGDEENPDAEGYVHRIIFTEYTDFIKDEIHYCYRWKVFIYDAFGKGGYPCIGKQTGYRTRKEALEVADKWIEENR